MVVCASLSECACVYICFGVSAYVCVNGCMRICACV